MADKKTVDLTKTELIAKEIKELEKTFDKLDINTKKSVKGLIANAAFMNVSLKELREIINEKGYVEEYQNGQFQTGYKKCSEVELYNTMIKNYSSVVKQLTELLPDAKTATQTTTGEDLAKFIIKGKPGGK